jgi:hypothetical protein
MPAYITAFFVLNLLANYFMVKGWNGFPRLQEKGGLVDTNEIEELVERFQRYYEVPPGRADVRAAQAAGRRPDEPREDGTAAADRGHGWADRSAGFRHWPTLFNPDYRVGRLLLDKVDSSFVFHRFLNMTYYMHTNICELRQSSSCHVNTFLKQLFKYLHQSFAICRQISAKVTPKWILSKSCEFCIDSLRYLLISRIDMQPAHLKIP